MWVRFTANFDFKPKPQITLAYRQGQERNVTRECARKAIAAKTAIEVENGKKSGGGQT